MKVCTCTAQSSNAFPLLSLFRQVRPNVSHTNQAIVLTLMSETVVLVSLATEDMDGTIDDGVAPSALHVGSVQWSYLPLHDKTKRIVATAYAFTSVLTWPASTEPPALGSTNIDGVPSHYLRQHGIRR